MRGSPSHCTSTAASAAASVTAEDTGGSTTKDPPDKIYVGSSSLSLGSGCSVRSAGSIGVAEDNAIDDPAWRGGSEAPDANFEGDLPRLPDAV